MSPNIKATISYELHSLSEDRFRLSDGCLLSGLGVDEALLPVCLSSCSRMPLALRFPRLLPVNPLKRKMSNLDDDNQSKELCIPDASCFRRSTSLGTLSECHRSLNSEFELLWTSLSLTVQQVTWNLHLSQQGRRHYFLSAWSRSRIPFAAAHPSLSASPAPRPLFPTLRSPVVPPSMTL